MTGRAKVARTAAGGASHPPLEIALSPRLSLEIDGRPVHFASRKARALLGYLALGDATEETRERLVGMLWSGFEEDKARASLRQIVHEIREAFNDAGFDGFHAGKLTVAIDRARLRVDLWSVVAAADSGRADPALLRVGRLPDTLLDDVENVDPAFRVWLLAKRQALHDRLVRGLEAGLRGAGADADDVARALVNLDPTHEEACRHLIRVRAARGDFGGALRQYKDLWDLLERDYDVEPSPATQELVVEIRNRMGADQAAPPAVEPSAGAPASPVAPARTAPPPTPLPAKAAPLRRLNIAVGAFDVLAVRPDDRYMVQGFRHELIASLIRFREWHVRDDASGAFVAPAGDDAGDSYRVEASAFTTADSIRLVLTMRDVRSGVFVWSDRYQLTLANWFDAQQAVIRRLATALNIHLSTERLTRLAASPDVSLDLHDQWLRAQDIFLRYHPDERERATAILRRVVREAPNFPRAYTGLAQANNTAHFAYPGLYRTAEVSRETLDLALAGVRLDPVDSLAHLALGWSYAYMRNRALATMHMDLAHELNDSEPWLQASLALFHAFWGDPARGRRMIVDLLEPGFVPNASYWVHASTVRFMAGDYEGCVADADRSGDAVWSNVAWRAAALGRLGDRGRAAAELRRFIDGARASWIAGGAPSDADIMRWLLSLYPIDRDEDWERLRAGLAAAGAPVDGIGRAG